MSSLLPYLGHSPLSLRPATFHAPPPPSETPPELSPRSDYLDLQNYNQTIQTVTNNGKGSFICCLHFIIILHPLYTVQ